MYVPKRIAETGAVELDAYVPARAVERPADLQKAVSLFKSHPRRAANPWRSPLVLRGAAVLGGVLAFSTLTAFALNGGAATVATVENSPAAVTMPTIPRAIVGGVLAEPELAENSKDLVGRSRAYTTEAVAVLATASPKAEEIETLDVGDKVQVTGEVSGEFLGVSLGDKHGWVESSKLTEETAELAAGIVEEPCARTSDSFENKLLPSTIRMYRSVCALFPEVNSFGGWRSGGRAFHKNGRAVDFMITTGKESKLGWRIANYVVKNAAEFDIDHVIFEQKIWTPSSRSWRKMADRGSINENHYNHVHVAVKAA